MSAESSARGPLPALFQDPAPYEEQFVPICLLQCDNGTVNTVPEPIVLVDRDVDTTPFQKLKNYLEPISCVDNIKYHTILFFGFTGGAMAEPFFAKLELRGAGRLHCSMSPHSEEEEVQGWRP